MGVQLRRLGPHSQIKALYFSENKSSEWVAGRGSHTDIFTKSRYASRRHFSIIYKNRNFFIYDHGSSNGTYLNDEKIQPKQEYPLSLQSTISVGVLSSFQNEDDCIVFVFELCKEGKESGEKQDFTSKLHMRKSDKYNHLQSEKTVGDCRSLTSVKVDSELCVIRHTSPIKNENSDIISSCKIKNEKFSEEELKSFSDITTSASNIQESEIMVITEKNMNQRSAVLCETINLEEEKDDHKLDFFSNGQFITNFHETDLNRQNKDSLDNDEILKAYEADTQTDEPQTRSSQLSYSVTEELVEITDSDEDPEMTVKTEIEQRKTNSIKIERDEFEEYDDDVIFIDNVTKNNENLTPVLEIKIEDDDFSDTDKKWMEKLFKTKEECDFFIQSQRENYNEACKEGDDANWMEFVANCADKIEEILLSEVDKVKIKSEVMDEVISDNTFTKSNEECQAGLDATQCSNHSTVIGVLTVSPGSSKETISISSGIGSEKSCKRTAKENQLRNNFNDDYDNEYLVEPKKKEPKLKNSLLTKRYTAECGIRNRIIKGTNIFQNYQLPSKIKQKRKESVGPPSSEREKIKNERKRKLKELSMREPAKFAKNEVAPRIQAPLKVKVTRKNRSEFLCGELNHIKDKEVNFHRIPSKITEKEGQQSSLIDDCERKSKELVENRPNVINLANINTSIPDHNDKNHDIPRVSECNSILNEHKSVVSEPYFKINCENSKETTLKSCLKKTGFSFMKSNRLIASKKIVTFDAKQNIRYYQTDNRISRKTSQLHQPNVFKTVDNNFSRFRSALYDICGWNAIWLEESKKAQHGELPPPFHADKLRNVQKKFLNHEEYVQSFIPLLLLETWHTISVKWKSGTNLNWRVPAICKSCVECSYDTDKNFILMMCESLIQDSSNSATLKEGDLVVVQYNSNTPINCQTIQNTKKLVFRIFGYVEKKIVETVNNNEGQSSNTEYPQIMKLNILVKKRHELKSWLCGAVQITFVHHVAPQLLMCQAVCSLPKSPLCSAILAPSRPEMTFSPPLKNECIVFKEALDEYQKELVLKLVSSCMSRDHGFFEIQGGPGTGKTHVVVAFILQLLYTNQWNGLKRPKILYCSHSNIVVDELALKLKNYRQTLDHFSRYKLVRFGNLNSIKPSVRDISSFQLALQNEFYADVARKIKSCNNEIKTLVAELETPYKLKSEEVEHRSSLLYGYVKYREELSKARPVLTCGRRPSSLAEGAILENADVICVTCCSSGSTKLINAFEKIKAVTPDQKIICIIDDAMQSKESETVIPLLLGVTHLFLFGDAQQLRPPIRNEVAQSLGINQSLFWRILSIFDKSKDKLTPVYTLRTQYRMRRCIAMFPNKIFYQGLLKDGYSKPTTLNIKEFLLLIDSGATAISEEECELRINSNAVKIMGEILKIISGNSGPSIGIITCRVEQAKVLRNDLTLRFGDCLLLQIEINSIEHIQGKEFDIVLFLFDVNMHCSFRANVALTRARHSLIILTSHPGYKSNKLLGKLTEEATIRNVFYFINDAMESHLLNKIITKFSK